MVSKGAYPFPADLGLPCPATSCFLGFSVVFLTGCRGCEFKLAESYSLPFFSAAKEGTLCCWQSNLSLCLQLHDQLLAFFQVGNSSPMIRPCAICVDDGFLWVYGRNQGAVGLSPPKQEIGDCPPRYRGNSSLPVLCDP